MKNECLIFEDLSLKKEIYLQLDLLESIRVKNNLISKMQYLAFGPSCSDFHKY